MPHRIHCVCITKTTVDYTVPFIERVENCVLCLCVKKSPSSTALSWTEKRRRKIIQFYVVSSVRFFCSVCGFNLWILWFSFNWPIWKELPNKALYIVSLYFFFLCIFLVSPLFVQVLYEFCVLCCQLKVEWKKNKK